MVRTRFAPSPTGFLHVGGLRTALYSYLIAKQNGGKFLLRIEDTDQKRSVEGAVQSLLNSLYWAGIYPDEGVTMDEAGKISQTGDNGPYIQSERLEIYKKHADDLITQGDAYYCFCTEERLTTLREDQQKNNLAPRYDGLCRKIDAHEAKKRASTGVPHVIRMKMPLVGEIEWDDAIRGRVSFRNDLVDDQVIIKTDGFPTYHLAAVVDDHLMEITHVVRGEEWVSSTPKHLKLYEYFGWQAPVFAHLSLLLNADKSKLSKRQGDVAVEDYAKKGYLPQAMINFVAFLGWNPGTEKEIFSLDELVKEFKIEKIGKSGAVFNLEKLDWYNREYLKKMDNLELAKNVLPWFKGAGYDITDLDYLAKVVSLEKERVTTLSELPAAVGFVFKLPEYDKNLLVWKKSTPEEAKKILQELVDLLNTKSVQPWDKASLESTIGEWIKTNGYTNGSVLWPLRVALSGSDKSPGPYEIAVVLGETECKIRLQVAVAKL